MSDMNATKRQLILSLIGSCVTALGAGTPYIYSYYAPKLLERCEIPISKSSSISFSLNIGSSLLAMFAGMIIDYNPALSCLIGAITTFFAYMILSICYKNAISNVFLISFALGLVGFGSISGFFAGVKVCTTNFPRHRGTATACPIALYALSGMVFSTICAKWFGDNMLGVFRFLQVVCTLMILVGVFTVKIVTIKLDDDEGKNSDLEDNAYNFNDVNREHASLERSTSLNQLSQISPRRSPWLRAHTRSRSALDTINSNGARSEPQPFFIERAQTTPTDNDSIHATYSHGENNNIMSQRNSLHMDGRHQNISVSRSNSMSPDGNATDGTSASEISNRPRYLSTLRKLHKSKVIQTIVDPKYLIYYVILAIQMGIGQMYIYSVGFIIQVQVNSPQLETLELNKAKLQAFQISLFAMFSFFGRLTSGPISDLLVRKLKSQRLWNIFFASLLVLLASRTITTSYDTVPQANAAGNSIPSIKNISLCTTLFGYAFGMTFGTFPSIIADTFGTDGFSTIWSICTTGGVFTVKLFTSILAHDLSSNSADGDLVCKKGVLCYKHTFNTIFDICALGVMLTGIMVFGTYWIEQQNNSNQETEHTIETIPLQIDAEI
ncbi:hypothetical protein DAKH74_013470 [Maudiozyma humilis]|uniref:Nodulin-like domain-containing protein n=1 Tax=Maudiozyma humilis TaxID=51915 RepID=A0AAV5RVQ7_MAUHU|nr:hypothetical protein DAKH74_013470 [Kazachstania humilis]